jgi:PAS domain S-box-containing protein
LISETSILNVKDLRRSRYNKYTRIICWIILFWLFSLINQSFGSKSYFETSIRLTIGLSFILYLWSPYKQWIFIFITQFSLTYLFSHNESDITKLIVSVTESLASLISAIVFLLVNKNYLFKLFRANYILKILVSSACGSLIGGLAAHYLVKAYHPVISHSLLWVTWSLAGTLGIILVTPVMTEFRDIKFSEYIRLLKKSILELTLLIISTLAITYLIFNNQLNDIYLSIGFPYAILPFVLWAAIRFHTSLLSLLLFIIGLLILYYINSATVTVWEPQPLQRITNSIQIFILFTGVFSYIVSEIIHVQQEVEKKIIKLNEELEERVKERTRVLQHTLEALGQSEEQFREAFETSLHGMALMSLKGNFLRVNQAFCDMIGYPMERLLRSNLRKVTHRDDYLEEMKKLKKLVKGEVSSYQVEKRLIHKDDLVVWVMESNSLVKTSAGEPSHIVSHIVDITERKQAEEQLRKYTETLTVLLREVNHRVKNNLSALIGILHMEEDRLVNSKNKRYIELLQDLNSRIRGLATVHSILSASNWQPIEISHLCEQIIQAVLEGLPLNKSVNLLNTKTNIYISSNQAHHLTLIINELATNSVKYGLANSSDNSIEVTIVEDAGNIRIVYKDNGPGYPEQIINGDFNNASIGFELIRGIVKQSLEGTLKLRNENGAVTEILFTNELNH